MGTGISPNFIHKQCSKEYSRILKLQHLSSWISRLRNWIHKQDKGSTHSRATQCDIVHQRPAVVDGTLSLRKFYIISCVGRCTCEVLVFHRKMPLLTANLLDHKILLGHHCLSIQCPPEFVSKGSLVHVYTQHDWDYANATMLRQRGDADEALQSGIDPTQRRIDPVE